MTGSYEKLEERFRRQLILRDASGILHWDSATMMPPGGNSGRAEQLAEMQALQHGMMCDPHTADLLDKAETLDGLDAWQKANLAAMRRNWRHATALDEKLVIALSKASSACEHIWRTARKDNDFKAVLPSMENLLSLVREVSTIKAEALQLSPYDALLDEYEPGGRSGDIDPLFAELESFLPDFLNRVLEKQAGEPAPVPPKGPFLVETQRQLAHDLMQAWGFDFNHGRLDVSLHPFCGGTADDVRITTRFDEAEYTSALMGVLHETGHALYERGLPEDWRYQPVGDALGMAVHESQSLLVEMQVCRSKAFLQYAHPLMKKAFSGTGPAWEVDNLYALLIHVEPGFIRVDADEITYPLHVILRYRLEKAMIEGDLSPRDLPIAWNDAMQNSLGIRPPTDREGCLQDIHWYDGAWGYFPTYTLGAMMAAQLFATASKTDTAIGNGIPKGDFSLLLAWLRENVHSLGSSLNASEMLERATGRPLESKDFIAHLKTRYLS